MGVIIDAALRFARRRQNAPSVEALCEFAMLRVTRNFDYHKPVEEAVRAVLQHPRFPCVRVDDEVLRRATAVLDESAREWDTVFTISLARLRRESGWDPMTLPACSAVTASGENYLLLSGALGASALVWQVSEYPAQIITTVEGFKLAYRLT